MDVARSWQRIAVWLGRYAPSYEAMLEDPAGEDEIEAIEQAVGVELPADLRAWWLHGNGIRSRDGVSGRLIPESYDPCAANTVLARRGMRLDVQRGVYPADLHAQPPG
ncbi:MAG TPA: SMI1/KNR4 family protein [Candidatus Limnocylindrales bacterium]|nr:SMI1/KNR4 family protein [Candidatus Limnocylindrales bacterium]